MTVQTTETTVPETAIGLATVCAVAERANSTARCKTACFTIAAAVQPTTTTNRATASFAERVLATARMTASRAAATWRAASAVTAATETLETASLVTENSVMEGRVTVHLAMESLGTESRVMAS